MTGLQQIFPGGHRTAPQLALESLPPVPTDPPAPELPPALELPPLVLAAPTVSSLAPPSSPDPVVSSPPHAPARAKATASVAPATEFFRRTRSRFIVVPPSKVSAQP
jgi:hypothetical protein